MKDIELKLIEMRSMNVTENNYKLCISTPGISNQ